MTAGVGYASHDDPRAAGEAAAQQAHAALQGATPKLVLVFDNVKDKRAMLAGVTRVFDASMVYGCSSYAPLTHLGNRDGVGVMALAGDVDVTVALANVREEDYAATGMTLGELIKPNVPADESLGKLMLLFGRCHVPRNDELVKGVKSVLGDTFPIVGGAASQGEAVYHRGKVTYGVNLAILLNGDFDVQMTLKQGEGQQGIIETAAQSIAQTAGLQNGESAIVFAFDCGGRRQTLGPKVTDELAAMRNLLGDTPLIGFYGSGEIGPTKNGQPAKGVGVHIAVGALRPRNQEVQP